MINFYKKILLFIYFMSIFGCFSQKNNEFYDFYNKKHKNLAFKVGEKAKYKFSYGQSNKKGILTAGYGQIEVVGISNIDNSSCFKVQAKGGTTKLFDFFYEVDDLFESHIETKNLTSLKFKRNIHEHNYKANQVVLFDRKNNYANTSDFRNSRKGGLKISNNTQDMLSALFASRNIPNENLLINDTIHLEIFNLEKNNIFPTYFVPINKETIKTKIGKLRTIKCKIFVEKSRIFSDKNSTYIWLTDDYRHLPVKVETPIRVGSIYIEILSVENL
ncbi:MAG: hypothetical protein CMP68_01850 [Flavobacteriales bacterium]|nr:hypothetical protein [Flavobacteriales bacterium]